MTLAPPSLRTLVPDPLRRLYRRMFPHRPPDLTTLWERSCQKWVVGLTHVSGDWLHGTGWLIAPPQVRPHVRFQVNGTPVDKADYPVARPDVARHLWFAPEAADSGFDFWLKVPPGTTDPGDLTVTASDARTGRPLGPGYAPVSVPSAARFGPTPPAEHMARVIGAPSDFYFRMGGWTAFKALEAAVRDATGRPLSAYPRVLDWGCGCGRVSRYFLPLPGVTVTGADVDPETVGWCRTNLPAGQWEVLPLRPPSALPDAGFDLAFGVSVFTHLKEPEQYAWLDELRRVIRPGGLALMTFHGEASVVWSGLSAERYAALLRDGVCDQPNPLYDADLGEDDYYRDTFHTADYVRQVWGDSFDVLDIRPSFVAHQDLAVLRRR